MLDEALVPLPATGRVFRAARRVRLADADRAGRLRLDACARYLQDIGNDDTADSGIDDPATSWVVRRAVVDVHRTPRWRERLELATWCGGLGGRWAERRLSLVGGPDGEGGGEAGGGPAAGGPPPAGGRIEVSTLWVHVDLATMAPARLPSAFLDAYGAAAGGRTVSSRRWLGGPPDGARTVPWPLRATDVDLLGHVNNAAYWAAVEEELAAGEGGHPLLARPHRAVMEYGAAIEPDAAVELRVASAADAVSVWFTVAGAVHAAATVVALPPAAALSPG